MDLEIFEPLDFSFFIKNKNCAIKCETEDQALHLVAAMKTQFPVNADGWELDEVHWKPNECYCLGLNEKDRFKSLLHAEPTTFISFGYKIVPFEEIPILYFTPCEESDLALDFLFKNEV